MQPGRNNHEVLKGHSSATIGLNFEFDRMAAFNSGKRLQGNINAPDKAPEAPVASWLGPRQGWI